MTLRARLLLALVPLFVLCLAVADAAVYADQQSFLFGQLQEQATNAQGWVQSAFLGGPGGPPGGGPAGAGSQPGVVWGEVLSASGAVVASPQFLGFPSSDRLSATANHPVLPSDLAASAGRYLTVSGAGQYQSYLVYSQVADDGSGELVVAAVPMDTYDASLGHLLLLEVLVGLAVVVLLVLAAWLIVRRGLRPLDRMAATAHAIAGGELGRRVTPSDQESEVGRLGLALNTMLEQLEAAFAQRVAVEQRLRQFVSDASHELRTPLTSMRGYAELLRRNPGMSPEELEMAIRRIEDEARRMGLLVDDLLLLARLDQGRPLERAPVDLEALVSDACADARVSDPGRAVTVRTAAPLTVSGDEPRLRQVMANLLRNAVVHTPPGTPIDVALRQEDGRAVIEVADHGPGIPIAARGRIFERFHRVDPERSRDQGGSGLGLSIVAAVVAAHGGRVGVSETRGGGATFRIELPLRS
ncbi:MAG TPA: HAMP domain-containing sensor histidine kinase [Candidatus Binatia bacterium]|nr:HAMP domain-containing sensor histidine kinase [Candidatus Binatia bacterium]